MPDEPGIEPVNLALETVNLLIPRPDPAHIVLTLEESKGDTGGPGPMGPQGLQGPVGPPLHAKGTVPTYNMLPGSATTNDLWTVADTGKAYVWNGSVWIDMGQFTGVQGPQGNPGNPGPTGPPGATGTAASVNAGTTTTLPPGSIATVTNVGSSLAAVFNFGIPTGNTGATGATGPMGQGLTVKGTVPTYASLPTTGNSPGDLWITADTGHGWAWDGMKWVDSGPVQGPAAYTFSTASFTVPAVGASVTVPVQSTGWIAIGEVLWIDNAGGPGVAGSMQVTAKTSTSVTLKNV